MGRGHLNQMWAQGDPGLLLATEAPWGGWLSVAGPCPLSSREVGRKWMGRAQSERSWELLHAGDSRISQPTHQIL